MSTYNLDEKEVIKFIDTVKMSFVRTHVYKKMGWHINGTGTRKFNYFVEKYGLDISHFSTARLSQRKPRKKVVCPVCGVEFSVIVGSPKQKTTCSKSCSNTYFRSGENHPSYSGAKHIAHRIICFTHYEKKCVLCGWDISVDVHHIDGDHKNNSPENLIPLCANHHKMAHMNKYKKEIADQISKIKFQDMS